jgi:hypothetical protein
MNRSCRRRSCASLPRRRASAADVAALRQDIAALDRGVVEVGQTADLALARADARLAVMAAPFESAGQRPAHLTLHQGGAA